MYFPRMTVLRAACFNWNEAKAWPKAVPDRPDLCWVGPIYSGMIWATILESGGVCGSVMTADGAVTPEFPER
jgi:hypothetical protein